MLYMILFQMCMHIFFADILRNKAAACCPRDMCCVRHLILQTHFLDISLYLFILQHDRTPEGCTSRGFNKDILCCNQITHQVIDMIVLQRHFAGKQMLHHAADKARRTTNRQTVCMGQTGKTEIFYADFVLQTGCHAD